MPSKKRHTTPSQVPRLPKVGIIHKIWFELETCILIIIFAMWPLSENIIVKSSGTLPSSCSYHSLELAGKEYEGYGIKHTEFVFVVYRALSICHTITDRRSSISGNRRDVTYRRCLNPPLFVRLSHLRWMGGHGQPSHVMPPMHGKLREWNIDLIRHGLVFSQACAYWLSEPVSIRNSPGVDIFQSRFFDRTHRPFCSHVGSGIQNLSPFQ